MSEREELEQEVLREFLAEGAENLARMDQEMVELERQPNNPELLASIFRTIHTVKGNCGFFGFTRLEAIAHVAENILNEVRQGERRLDTPLTSLILECMDAIRRMLASIEKGDGEGPDFERNLIVRLKEAWEQGSSQSHVDKLAARAPAVKSAVTTPEEFIPTPAGNSGKQTIVAPEMSGTPKARGIGDNALRIDVELLDRIMNLVGELVLTRNQLLQHSASQDDSGQDDALIQISQRFDLITSELQGEVMKTRMQPVSVVWNKLPRVVRDLATSLNKSIDLQMYGADTELDRTIIEAIRDPLTHIVRNSCDHGIETPEEREHCGKPRQGQLTLRAYHESGKVNIEISDDGAGIDPQRIRDKAVERGLISPEQADRLSDHEAIRMVFLPGFSTAAAVTNVSGRGVGMDVVKTNIERVGGTIDLISRLGEGATVKVNIPLTLAIIPGLIVTSGGERFVIPQVNIHELLWYDGDSVKTRVEYVHKTPVIRQRDGLLPLLDLNVMQGVAPMRPSDELSIVVLQAEGRRFGLIVDSIRDTEEIVVKPLGSLFHELDCYAGATIMGDGGIALILDVNGIGLRSGVLKPQGESALATSTDSTLTSAARCVAMLLFRAGKYPRIALPLSQVSRLERIPRDEVERAGGQMVVQYRNEILPLVMVGEMFGGNIDPDAEIMEVIVCRNQFASLGLVVDEVMDAVEEPVGSLCGNERPGLLGSAVIGGQVTDILDLDALIALGAPPVDAAVMVRLNSAIGSQFSETLAQEARR
jgi:two-component system chemotaxis sensor kinase CheA